MRSLSSKPALEVLEDRWVPALLLQLDTSSNLTGIFGVPAGNVTFLVTNPDEINVNENGNDLGTYSVPGNLNVQLGNSLLGPLVLLDLNGNDLSGNVNIAVGNSNPGYFVFVDGTGTIGGNVSLSKGSGFGQLGIGPDINGVGAVTTVAGNVNMRAGDAADDLLLGNTDTTNGTAIIDGSFYGRGGNELGSAFGQYTISGNLTWTSAAVVPANALFGQFSLTSTSSVAGNVSVTMANNGTDGVNLRAGGTILGNAVFNMANGDNNFLMEGGATIAGRLTIVGGNGVDNVNIQAGAILLDNVSAVTNGGNDNVILNGTIAGSSIMVNTGNGNDSVTMTTLSAAGARLTAFLGNGNDSVTLNATTSTLGSAYLDGGLGTDAFSVTGVIAFPIILRSF